MKRKIREKFPIEITTAVHLDRIGIVPSCGGRDAGIPARRFGFPRSRGSDSFRSSGHDAHGDSPGFEPPRAARPVAFVRHGSETRPMRIFISAGEPSGDLHAANLMLALRERLPDAEFIGYGGPRMAEAGAAL